MASREDLQVLLEEILGSENVYFQPPEDMKLSYPAIVYSRDDIQNTHANDGVYHQNNLYSITVIDRDPDSEIVSKISTLPLCRYSRNYKADNLNHDVFELYY